MAAYNKVSEEFLRRLRLISGRQHVFADREKLVEYQTDEETDPLYHHLPEAVVFPGSAQEISQILKLANEYLIPVTPRGAGTSLAGGAIPVRGGLVLVLTRMDRIIEINKKSLYMKVECGVPTEKVQK
ncbi:MAG: FAD-binding oxidoreductase, partial [Acidaminococcales bacterium]|nr:FAD-binding oxidoreductase [Acidaminococcales bacterium]